MNDLPEELDKGSYSYQDSIGQSPTRIRFGNYFVHFITGVPAATLGSDNEFAFRFDGTVAGNTVAYHKQGGAWVAFTTA